MSVVSGGVVLGTSTAAFATSPPVATIPATFVAGSTLLSTVESGSVVSVFGAGGSVIVTLTEGGPSTTIDGQGMSMGTGGLLVGGSTTIALGGGSPSVIANSWGHRVQIGYGGSIAIAAFIGTFWLV